MLMKAYMLFIGVRKLYLNAFKCLIFLSKTFQGIGLKVLTSKEMLQRLSITLAQVKPYITSESLLNEFCHIIYSLYRAKEITKKLYKNIIDSIKL